MQEGQGHHEPVAGVSPLQPELGRCPWVLGPLSGVCIHACVSQRSVEYEDQKETGQGERGVGAVPAGHRLMPRVSMWGRDANTCECRCARERDRGAGQVG